MAKRKKSAQNGAIVPSRFPISVVTRYTNNDQNAITLLESRKDRVKPNRRSRASQLLRRTGCGSSDGEESSTGPKNNRLSTLAGNPTKPGNDGMTEWLDALGYTVSSLPRY